MSNITRSRRKRNQTRQGRRFKYEAASAVNIRGKMASWGMAHKFVSLSPVVQAVRSDPVATTFFKYSFQLDDVNYFKNFSQYFEEYKIQSITLIYKPLITEVVTAHSSTASSEFTVPDVVYCYLPYSTTLSSYDQLVSRGDSIVVNSTERFQTTFQPVPLIRGYDSLLGDGFIDMGPKWINTNQRDVPHYGFGIAIQPTSALSADSPTFGGRIELYYTVVFRYPREDSGGLLAPEQKELAISDEEVGSPLPPLGARNVLVRRIVEGHGNPKPEVPRQPTREVRLPSRAVGR